MIYIGHFSFDALGREDEPHHGYVTCLGEAGNADHALEAFKGLLKTLQATDAACVGWRAVYIEDIIELARLPAQPIVTRYQSSAGKFPKSVSHTLPMTDSPDIVAYGLGADLSQLDSDGEDEYSEMNPFLTF